MAPGYQPPLINTPFNTWGAAVSPNGRWFAYSSNESGRQEIYVHSYPDIEGGKWQISVQGGREPRWSPSGDELFYLEQNAGVGTLWSVSIDDSNGRSLNPGLPMELLDGFTINGRYPPSYAVSSDGSQFIQFNRIDEDQLVATGTSNGVLTVVENWFEELNRLAPSAP